MSGGNREVSLERVLVPQAPVLVAGFREVLWLTGVVGLGVTIWLQQRRAHQLDLDRKLWKTRALQLKGQVESNEDVEVTVEFLPAQTKITYGKYRQDEPATVDRP